MEIALPGARDLEQEGQPTTELVGDLTQGPRRICGDEVEQGGMGPSTSPAGPASCAPIQLGLRLFRGYAATGDTRDGDVRTPVVVEHHRDESVHGSLVIGRRQAYLQPGRLNRSIVSTRPAPGATVGSGIGPCATVASRTGHDLGVVVTAQAQVDPRSSALETVAGSWIPGEVVEGVRDPQPGFEASGARAPRARGSSDTAPLGPRRGLPPPGEVGPCRMIVAPVLAIIR